CGCSNGFAGHPDPAGAGGRAPPEPLARGGGRADPRPSGYAGHHLRRPGADPTPNATACRDLGRTGTELRGDSCCALYCGGGHRFESCMVLQTIQHRKSFSKEVKFNGRRTSPA
ncbi:MAG: hypothetical protein V8T86_04630, partial [Victivallis sp.]